MFPQANVEGSLPLRESTFLILLSLSNGPRHGYAIMKEVAALSGDRVHLSTGTLYGALKRLLADNWIQRTEAGPSSGLRDGGSRRRTYVLTDLGRGLLEAEVARLRSLVAAVDLRTSGMQA